MITKILKWAGILLGSIVIFVTLTYVWIYYDIERRAAKIYDVKVQKLIIPTDSASLSRGKHLAVIRACTGCHGKDFAGGYAFADDQSPIGILYSVNITSGKGGVQYTNEDWIRTLRHGLGRDNRSLWFMPSHEIYKISNQDMASLISYVKTRPPVDKISPSKSLKPLGRILTFLGKFPLFPAEKIDHDATYPDVVMPSITPEYGQYLAITCTGCHTATLKGADSHGPNEPKIPDITSTGHLGKWTAEAFITTLQTGKTPEKKQLSSAMPWREFTYTRDELRAIFSYLHNLR
ncbi:c-type cytochrome [Dyadobacter frigoris]|uniref:Cytochrome c n=1 Tax=Dyadobacter frigoris TaxID=2576211 RepID=A0A4U6D5F9_9BACT|nr:cytochrome c [Dyadobacter frigoris]TKT92590.1 cytochrome c [Dyadobacter frigoris]